ncbi:carbohydrate kinase [Ktedonobacteria bacterium brp13]|nr:carbohydrate kinase [Ktedonobacteria bacterium brp13]
MAALCTLGIDVGTTGLKVVVLHRDRGIVAQATRPHDLVSAHPGWAEEDPEQWWTTTQEAVRELLAIVPAEEIAAVGVSGMVPALVLLDAAGRPVRPSIQQNDARTIVEVAELRAAVDPAEFFAVTGGVVNQQNIDPRWRWLQRHEPEQVARTAHICGSYDFIRYRLTSDLSLEENWAVESAFYDIRLHRWHTPYLEHARLNPALLPPVRQPSAVVAGISKEAAEVTGLRAGTPVVTGSADHVAAALAAGLTQTGDLLLKFGGAGDILYCTDHLEPDPHFYFDYHDIPGMGMINGCMATSGSLVKWFAKQVAGGMSLAALDHEAEGIPPGSDGILLLPYFLGEKTPIFDPSARGVFAGVMLHHTRAHLYRSVLEAVCYGFVHHLTLLYNSGRPVQRVLAADGGSRSSLWMQIAADMTDHTIEVVAGEAASALGTAFVAAMGVHLFPDWNEITRFVTRGPVYRPQKEVVQRYQKGFALYQELYTRLHSFLPELAQLQDKLKAV